MKKSDRAIGILEMRGITASLEAADAMVKAADVLIIGTQKIGNALIYVVVSGMVDAVCAAVKSGKRIAAELGEVYASTVIARPSGEVLDIIRLISK